MNCKPGSLAVIASGHNTKIRRQLINESVAEHQRQRRELWKQVAVAVASSSNSTTKGSMTSWADHALAEFDKRFGGAA